MWYNVDIVLCCNLREARMDRVLYVIVGFFIPPPLSHFYKIAVFTTTTNSTASFSPAHAHQALELKEDCDKVCFFWFGCFMFCVFFVNVLPFLSSFIFSVVLTKLVSVNNHT